MQITKITEQYEFVKEGNDYVINFGNVKKTDNKSVTLLFQHTKELILTPTCGCTLAEREDLENGDVIYKINYNQCDTSFAKTIVGSRVGGTFKIKLLGRCE